MARRKARQWRLLLFFVLTVMIAVAVLGGAVTLLPPPPASPTPTLPYFLGQPEALPRLVY